MSVPKRISKMKGGRDIDGVMHYMAVDFGFSDRVRANTKPKSKLAPKTTNKEGKDA